MAASVDNTLERHKNAVPHTGLHLIIMLGVRDKWQQERTQVIGEYGHPNKLRQIKDTVLPW